MSIPPVARYTLVGLGIVAVLAGALYLANRPSQVRLEGQVLMVRTLATDDQASLAILEFRFVNPAQVPFLVREAKVTLTDADGNTFDADTVAEMDLDRVLSYYKFTGPRYNPTLKTRERFPGGATADRTIAASFPVAESRLKSRRGFAVRIEDSDGAVVVIREQR